MKQGTCINVVLSEWMNFRSAVSHIRNLNMNNSKMYTTNIWTGVTISKYND